MKGRFHTEEPETPRAHPFAPSCLAELSQAELHQPLAVGLMMRKWSLNLFSKANPAAERAPVCVPIKNPAQCWAQLCCARRTNTVSGHLCEYRALLVLSQPCVVPSGGFTCTPGMENMAAGGDGAGLGQEFNLYLFSCTLKALFF